MNDTYTVPPEPVAPGDPGAAAPEASDGRGASTGPGASPGTATATLPDHRRATLARVGLLGIAAAAFVAVAMLAFGSSLAPARTLAGTDSTDGATGTANELGGIAGGRMFGHMFGGITITAINGNDISLQTEDGWTRTITVDADTEYSKSGDDIALSDLAVGDTVGFRQTREDDGTWTIDAIVVILPHVGGEVTAIDGSTITVAGRGDETATITVNGDTTYQVNGDDATLADVEVGMVLIAEGTDNGDGSITATEVKAADRGGFFEGRPGFGGPGRHGFGFGFGFGPGFEHDGTSPDATAAPTDDSSAS